MPSMKTLLWTVLVASAITAANNYGFFPIRPR
jgi:hypothetical protein